MCKSLKDVYEKQQSEAAKRKSQEEKRMYTATELVLFLFEGKTGSVTPTLYTEELCHL